MLLKHNYVFYSDTDTEIIGNLLHYYLKKTDNFKKAFMQTCTSLEGLLMVLLF